MCLAQKICHFPHWRAASFIQLRQKKFSGKGKDFEVFCVLNNQKEDLTDFTSYFCNTFKMLFGENKKMVNWYFDFTEATKYKFNQEVLLKLVCLYIHENYL